MRILVTGGTGFVGKHFIERALSEGHQVMVASRSPRRAKRMFPSEVIVRKKLHKFVKDKPEIIVNLAGAPIANRRWSDSQKTRLIESRRHTTREVVALCERLAEEKSAPKALISGSAVGFYGDQGSRVVEETTPAHDEFQHRLCEMWEQEAEEATEFGVRVALLRTGLVLDYSGGMLKKMLPAFKFGLGGQLGEGTQYMPWIHRWDLVSMIFFLIEHESLSGPFNASAPNPVTNKEFTRTLGKALNRPTFMHIPSAALHALLGEMSRLLLTGANMQPKRFLQEGFTFRYAELQEALAKPN